MRASAWRQRPLGVPFCPSGWRGTEHTRTGLVAQEAWANVTHRTRRTEPQKWASGPASCSAPAAHGMPTVSATLRLALRARHPMQYTPLRQSGTQVYTRVMPLLLVPLGSAAWIKRWLVRVVGVASRENPHGASDGAIDVGDALRLASG